MSKFTQSANDDGPVSTGHAFAETRDLHPTDQRIRRAGFAIHARPRRGEATWIKGGELWTQSEVVRYLKLIAEERDVRGCRGK